MAVKFLFIQLQGISHRSVFKTVRWVQCDGVKKLCNSNDSRWVEATFVFPSQKEIIKLCLLIYKQCNLNKFQNFSCGAPSLLARPVYSSSKLSYIDNCPPFSNVVSLEGKK